MRSGTYMDARAFSTRFGQTLVSESKERERVLLIPECGFEWSLLHVTSGGSHLKKKKIVLVMLLSQQRRLHKG